MGKIGSRLVARHDAKPGERVVWRGRAMRILESGGPVGGELSLTNRRLLFSPHLLERLFRNERVAIDRTDVVKVRASPPLEDESATPVARKLGDHFGVKTADGTTEYFGVTDAAPVLDRLDGGAGNPDATEPDDDAGPGT